MIAKHRNRGLFDILGYEFTLFKRERVQKTGGPDPFDILIAGDVRNIVFFVTGLDQRLDIVLGLEFLQVDDHAPVLAGVGAKIFLILRGIQKSGLDQLEGAGAGCAGCGEQPGFF